MSCAAKRGHAILRETDPARAQFADKETRVPVPWLGRSCSGSRQPACLLCRCEWSVRPMGL